MKLIKKSIKSLSNNKAIINDATPHIAGGVNIENQDPVKFRPPYSVLEPECLTHPKFC
ncbi:hypothetical protein [Pseudoalteromonas luteoviolacea]|uniref:Uncharacterized protein n=1 Tax=Pseudoalteromonas luteoviolacea H33 TaxID=1365251 RepID=A0A161Y7U3_9GAMM|nr:hypothetical protein [Pseudoalteromonas luteoviolacea]KZN51761.1 hypothetical protein N476_12010 [Pseudoalteromonas luteoviolacea H33]KZN72766.1 hypothetical protein N477_24550 [Pseudoalteromonas luteoviolacea H33-S]